MKLRKVISGGQSGADKAGLICARERGFETGGTAPKGYRTEYGPDLSLKDFGLVEHRSASYGPRTYANVHDSEITVWFGDENSPGCVCTRKACAAYRRMIVYNPTPEEFRLIAEHHEVVNVAGNRQSTNPDVAALVAWTFASIPTRLTSGPSGLETKGVEHGLHEPRDSDRTTGS